MFASPSPGARGIGHNNPARKEFKLTELKGMMTVTDGPSVTPSHSEAQSVSDGIVGLRVIGKTVPLTVALSP
jgi:hypothetical protein